MAVNLHSVLLFNLADQLSRNSSEFGILLGTKTDDNVTSIHTSFEILINRSSQNGNEVVVDLSFLQKRYEQFQIVLPNYHVVGVYQMNTLEPTYITNSILNQISAHIPNPEFVVLFYNGEKSLSAYPYNGENILNTAQKIQLNILANDEIEKISTFTIANHSQYTGSTHAGGPKEAVSTSTRLADHYKILSGSVDQLTKRVEKILKYVQENILVPSSSSSFASDESYATYSKLQNLITHLSNKVEEITSLGKTDPNLVGNNVEAQLLSSKLSLLNSQMTSLESLRATVTKQIIRAGNIAQTYPQQGPQPHILDFNYSGNSA
ncbi:hypothetical protein CLIB1423_27S00452 [[Candida] railenensis]|uniref:JAB1/MPN/MOV34 metalloenzyme domain-containing protein n=1 Tax=[Candida] railenensis TaxID=45579 RepID=A0A9P0QVM8_9ASCO|nr:hypothetical protein CLIB1423_27S00452 [[Candida] railenensis]